MSLDDLKQYKLLKREIADLEQRVKRESKVTDVVSGSSSEPPYTKHPISVTGYTYNNKLKSKYARKLRELQKKAIDIEEYVQSIDDSLVRQIFRYKYIDCLSREMVAEKLHYSARQIQRIHDKFVRHNMS